MLDEKREHGDQLVFRELSNQWEARTETCQIAYLTAEGVEEFDSVDGQDRVHRTSRGLQVGVYVLAEEVYNIH